MGSGGRQPACLPPSRPPARDRHRHRYCLRVGPPDRTQCPESQTERERTRERYCGSGRRRRAGGKGGGGTRQAAGEGPANKNGSARASERANVTLAGPQGHLSPGVGRGSIYLSAGMGRYSRCVISLAHPSFN